MSTPAPPISPALLEWLEEVFPDQVPRNDVSQRTLGVRQGEQRVIRKLRKEHQQQTQREIQG